MVVIYIVLFIASFLFYILYEGAFSFYLFCFTAVLPILLFSILGKCRRSLKVSFLQATKSSCKSDKIPVIIKVENGSVFPIANCIITVEYSGFLKREKEKFTVNTPVFPKNSQYLTVNISSNHYGIVCLKISSVKIVDMLKLFKRRVAYDKKSTFLRECVISVVPDYIQLDNTVRNYAESGLETDTYSSSCKGDDPSEIFDIHEYADGDKISRIHWKLTAKQDKIMVKDYSLPITNSVLIAVDLYSEKNNRGDSFLYLYDSMIETVSAISLRLLENECPHKICWYDSRKKSAVFMNIKDTDDYAVMINEILKAPLCDTNREMLDSLTASEENVFQLGHLIYCTAMCDDRLFERISDVEFAYRKTIMAMTENSDLELFGAKSENCTVVSVTNNAVAESIRDVEL